ncbi:MAG: glycosyltransferase [Cryomorphaceae bacterium]|jgi:glycosyltransferase involved in cell wall biosynthesis|nr:glycosyltransferase [Cryomorphaceae bacterium]
MSIGHPIEISLVIPTFNEEGNVLRLYDEIKQVLLELHIAHYEVIFIDDGSSDASLQRIEELRKQDTNVHFLQLSRNFGHQHALKAGLDHASGAAVISLDADLQHPPALIKDMIQLWRNGAEVVYTRRKDQQNIGIFKKWSAKAFYWFANKISEVPIEEGTADFRLLDQKVVAAIQTFKESHLFLRGLIPTLGFKQVALDYEPAARFSGKSKYSLSKMFHFAINGITSSSAKPLYFSIYLGLFFAFLAFVYGCYAIYIAIFTDAAITGWTSLIASVLFIGGIQMILIGIVGIYLGKLFVQSKQRPTYLIKNTTLTPAPNHEA